MQKPPDTARKIYFASDFHLGAPDRERSLEREKKIVRWLESIEQDAAEIFLVGDIFDFWYEYATVIPRGYTRLLGKLAQLQDKGIRITVFTGNHDMWMFGYFEEELGIPVHKAPIVREWNGKKFYIGHGDGLGPGDHGYKFIKKVFSNRICQRLFGMIHPRWGIGLANYFSQKSRHVNGERDAHFLGDENEWLVIYSKEVLQTAHFDYFIFGHRHLPLDIALNSHSRYVNLGDWIRYFTYAVFDGDTLALKTFEE